MAGRLLDDLRVRAVDRGELDTDGYRRFAAGRLDRHAPDLSAAARTALVGRIDHARADVTSAEQTRAALADLPRLLAAYLALPPAVYAATIRALVAAGLGEGGRVVVEKPFGRGRQEAAELNRLLARTVGEPAVFRVDHVLGLQTVQNVLGLRFANRVFEAV